MNGPCPRKGRRMEKCALKCIASTAYERNGLPRAEIGRRSYRRHPEPHVAEATGELEIPRTWDRVMRYSVAGLVIVTTVVAVLVALGVHLGFGPAAHGCFYILLSVAIRHLTLTFRYTVAGVALAIGVLLLFTTLFVGYPRYHLGMVYDLASVPAIVEGFVLFPISTWFYPPGEGVTRIRPLAVTFFWLGLGAAFGLSALFTTLSNATRRSSPAQSVPCQWERPPTPGK